MNPIAKLKQSAFIARIHQHKVFDPLRGQGLKALALKGSAWTIAGFGAQKVFQFGSNLILTRLLFPEAFGLMALINVFIIGLAMFSDIGIKPAIIQHARGEDPNFLNTAWTIQVIRGFALWGFACLIAWPVAQLYGQPILLPLLCFVGISAAIQGFESTALATSNRKLQLSRLTIINLAGQIVSIITMIFLAWLYESVWALAAGSVIGTVVSTILSHVVLPSHNHRFHVEREAFMSLLNFGKWIFLATLITFFGGNGIRAIQGLLISPGDLGIIYIASMIAWAIGELAGHLLSAVGFPALSKIAREDNDRFAEVLNRIRLRILAATIPALIVLSFIALPLITLLYDDRYSTAGPFLAIMAINSAIAIVSMTYQFAFMAQGDSRSHFILSAALMVFRVSGLIIGFYLAGTTGMLVGIGVGTFAVFVTSAIFAYKNGWLSPGLDLLVFTFIFCGAGAAYVWNTWL